VVVSAAFGEPLVHLTPDLAWQALEEDVERWRTWTAGIPDDLPFRAAASVPRWCCVCSPIPRPARRSRSRRRRCEHAGGVRNWDYRFTWPRDASIGVAAFLGLEKQSEAQMFLRWLLHASRLDRPRLPVVLTLEGRRAPEEKTVEEWPGYLDSRPVRRGNGARAQHQLNGYGWAVDAMHLFDRRHRPLDGETWRTVAAFAAFAAGHWHRPDAGIWEQRGDPAHHTHSKLMAWLALDRAIDLTDTHRARASRVCRWRQARDDLAIQIRSRGFNPYLRSYTRTLDGDDLDAALLILPLLGIEPADSPRVTGTIDAIREHLHASGPHVYRYRPGDDGLPETEGAFLPCSFWLVQALAANGRKDEAHALMAEFVDAAPLGLYSEEVDPASDRLLGTSPRPSPKRPCCRPSWRSGMPRLEDESALTPPERLTSHR
jgi:GH15 family glucan-1,4-alpha-glucosidase